MLIKIEQCLFKYYILYKLIFMLLGNCEFWQVTHFEVYLLILTETGLKQNLKLSTVILEVLVFLWVHKFNMMMEHCGV